MKKKKLVLVYFVVFSAAVFFARCSMNEDVTKLKDSLAGLQVYMATPTFTTGARFEFVDAQTNEFIDNELIKVTVSGKDQALVHNNIGEQFSAYTTDHGRMELVLDPHKVNNSTLQQDPVKFNITAVANGYLSVTQNVLISAPNSKVIRIKLIKLDSKPEGVAIAVNNQFTTTNASGKVATRAFVEMNSGSQEFEIPVGVILKNEQGNPVAGKIKSEIVFFDPTSSEGLQSVPGGMAVNATMPDGSTQDITFVSAGMMFISLTVDDQKVKTMENGGMKIKTKVSNTIINPETGQPVKENDKIAMWSIDDGTGKWTFEKYSTIRRVNGELVLEETINHLSGWNWDFHYGSCNLGPKITWIGLDALSKKEIPQAYITTDFVKGFNSSSSLVTLDADGLQLMNTPSNVPVRMEINHYLGNLASTLSFSPSVIVMDNMCDGQNYEITVTETLNTAVEFVTANFNLTATTASDTSVVATPSTWLYTRCYYNDKYRDNSLFLNKGKVVTNFAVDTQYQIAGSFGKYYGYGFLKVEKHDASNYKVTLGQIHFGSNTSPESSIQIVPKNDDGSINVKFKATVKSL